MIDKRTMGKRSRAAGKSFELRVRKDLEKQGWIVDRWSNNVDLEIGKMIKAKHTFNPFTKAMSAGNGFPDFIAFKIIEIPEVIGKIYTVISIESKMNGKLDRIEKEKLEWLKANNIFSSIKIASKGQKRGEIVYEEF